MNWVLRSAERSAGRRARRDRAQRPTNGRAHLLRPRRPPHRRALLARCALCSPPHGANESAPSHASDAPAELEKVRVTLVHGSLEHADFPVIVGHYDDAPIRGAEGVVDSRLDGVLSRHDLVGRYPSQIGESMFLRAPQEDVQYPVGVYVIGLGQTGDLNKGDLTTAVTKAVLDRCLRLYQHEGERHRTSPGHAKPQLRVGVSSVLIGSSLEAGGLAVDTSLAAIVEGIVRANQSLARYEEESPPTQRSLPSVRIAAIQIIERYADRCELASRALVDIVDLVGSDRAAVLEVDTVPEMPRGSAAAAAAGGRTLRNLEPVRRRGQ